MWPKDQVSMLSDFDYRGTVYDHTKYLTSECKMYLNTSSLQSFSCYRHLQPLYSSPGKLPNVLDKTLVS